MNTSKIRKIIMHTAAIVGLYLVFSFALFLGLQMDPAYGNIGVVVTVGLIALYIYFGFIRK